MSAALWRSAASRVLPRGWPCGRDRANARREIRVASNCTDSASLVPPRDSIPPRTRQAFSPYSPSISRAVRRTRRNRPHRRAHSRGSSGAGPCVPAAAARHASLGSQFPAWPMRHRRRPRVRSRPPRRRAAPRPTGRPRPRLPPGTGTVVRPLHPPSPRASPQWVGDGPRCKSSTHRLRPVLSGSVETASLLVVRVGAVYIFTACPGATVAEEPPSRFIRQYFIGLGLLLLSPASSDMSVARWTAPWNSLEASLLRWSPSP